MLFRHAPKSLPTRRRTSIHKIGTETQQAAHLHARMHAPGTVQHTEIHLGLICAAGTDQPFLQFDSNGCYGHAKEGLPSTIPDECGVKCYLPLIHLKSMQKDDLEIMILKRIRAYIATLATDSLA